MSQPQPYSPETYPYSKSIALLQGFAAGGAIDSSHYPGLIQHLSSLLPASEVKETVTDELEAVCANNHAELTAALGYLIYKIK